MITLNQVRKYYDQKEGFVLALSCDSLTLGDGEVNRRKDDAAESNHGLPAFRGGNPD